MSVRSKAHPQIAAIMVAVLLLVAFSPLLSVAGCETACALSIMPTGHCSHSAMSPGGAGDSGAPLAVIGAQQGLVLTVLTAALLLVLSIPTREAARVVAAEVPIGLDTTRIRI